MSTSSSAVENIFSLIVCRPFWRGRYRLVPKELEASATPGKGAEVRLVDKQQEEYVAPAYVAYSGEGQTMG